MPTKKYCLFFLILLFLLSCCRRKTESVLIVGDSLLCGYKIPEKKSVCSILEKKLNKNTVSYCEIGLSASSFSKKLYEYDTHSFSYVIIELGANDFLLNQSAQDTRDNLLEIIHFFHKKSVDVYIVSFIDKAMFSLGYNTLLLQQYENMYKTLQDEAVFVITNIWNNKFLDAACKADDFHPNETGSKIIARSIIRHIHD